MSKNAEERLVLIKDKIEKIFTICEDGIVKALEDDTQKRPAILMHLTACDEQLQKIQDSGDMKALSVFTPENIRGIRSVRNFIAHDYEGVNLSVIEDVIRNYLPSIKTNIDKFISMQKEINNDTQEAVLSRFGAAYAKKVQSGAIKVPTDSKKEKEKERWWRHNIKS